MIIAVLVLLAAIAYRADVHLTAYLDVVKRREQRFLSDSERLRREKPVSQPVVREEPPEIPQSIDDIIGSHDEEWASDGTRSRALELFSEIKANAPAETKVEAIWARVAKVLEQETQVLEPIL